MTTVLRHAFREPFEQPAGGDLLQELADWSTRTTMVRLGEWSSPPRSTSRWRCSGARRGDATGGVVRLFSPRGRQESGEPATCGSVVNGECEDEGWRARWTGDVDRRKFLVKAGATAAVAGGLWAAPEILSPSRAFAGTSCLLRASTFQAGPGADEWRTTSWAASGSYPAVTLTPTTGTASVP